MPKRPGRRWPSDPAKTVHVLRLSGIYGPGRNPLVNLAEGRAHRYFKVGQVFNRIHVEDIARACAALVAYDGPSDVWNVTDDEPAPPQDVVAFAAEMMGIEPPPEQDFETADLSPMARSFYGENKRCANRKIKDIDRAGLGLSHLSRGDRRVVGGRRRPHPLKANGHSNFGA